MKFSHIPVLLNETIDALNINPDGIYVDGTSGGGGHSYEIALKLSEKGRLFCVDRDADAIAACKKKLRNVDRNIEYIHSEFDKIPQIFKEKGIKIDGFLADLGVSSYQLDNASRGFSYMKDAPLDMRMNVDSDFSAADVVNGYSANELAKIFFEYGEEKYSRKIANAIVQARENRDISSTFQLVEIIKSAIPPSAMREKQHPAKRVFQAIRIEVNGELLQLSSLLENIIFAMNENGRIAIITFHSLEDRLVKNAFSKLQKPCTCPPEFPVCVCGKRSYGQVVGKVITATEEEIARNPRSRSAKLRVFEKKTDLNQRRKIFE